MIIIIMITTISIVWFDNNDNDKNDNTSNNDNHSNTKAFTSNTEYAALPSLLCA